MNPFKYIWLFIKFVYQAIIHEYQDRKNQEELDKLFKTLNTGQDEATLPRIDPMDLKIAHDMLSNKGTGVVVGEDQRIWFNQN